MHTIPDLTVTIVAAGRSRTISVRELEARLGVELRPALLRLAFARPTCPQAIHEEGGVGEEGASSLTETATVLKNVLKTVQTARGTKRGCGGEQGEIAALAAATLSELLDDRSSLAFFRHVVLTVPPEIVDEALTAALDVPRGRLRRSRGAYFTAVLRRLASRKP
jgi:hypothetical protein